ncbi:MAG: hypothetical protein ABI054_14520 [Planctomycetota bacterium]
MWLAVASGDEGRAAALIEQHWRDTCAPETSGTSSAGFDLDADELECPACGRKFANGPTRCPGCGLRFG